MPLFQSRIGYSTANRSRRRSTALRLATARAQIEPMEQRILLAMPTLWTPEGPSGGGATLAPVIAPNGKDLWICSDMSGIYHSTDYGQTWQMVNFHTSIGGVNGDGLSAVRFTSDPNILYLAGDTNAGPVKSADDGATWAPLSGWTYGGANWMASDLSTTTNILISNGSNLYYSSNGGTSFATAYTSTSLFVAGAFFDGSNVYVGTNKGFLTSSNGGASFSLAAQQPANTNIMSFTGAKEGATVRLFALTTTGSSWDEYSPYNLAYDRTFRLDVGGNWVDKSAAIAAVPSGGTPHFISMAQNNINIVYTGGGDAIGCPQVLKSTDGGNTWADTFFAFASDVPSNLPNANVATGAEGRTGDFEWWWGGPAFGFSVSPTDANKAIISECWVHVTSDGGTTWHEVNAKQSDLNPMGQLSPKYKPYTGTGLNMTGIHFINWMSPTEIMASYTDVAGARSTDGGTSWAYPNWNGVVSNSLNNTVYSGGKLYGATTNVHNLYGSLNLTDAQCNPSGQTGGVVVSADKGATWSSIHSFGVPVVWIAIDPNNANRMYASVVDGVGSSDSGAKGGIWVTNNLNLGASSTWTKLANPPRTQGHPFIIQVLNDGTLVVSYSGRRAGSPQVFTDSSGIFISTDGGTTWVDRTGPNMHWYTMDVVIDPTDPTQNRWYAGVNNCWGGPGNGMGDLYRTTDRGVTWTRINLAGVFGVPWADISSVTINAGTKEMYVASGTSGLAYTPDVTVPSLSSANFTNVTSYPFAWNERVFVNPYNSQDIWVASFGGGIIRGGVGPDTLSATAVSASQISLTWADNSSNETGFAIDEATDAAFTQNLVTTTAAQNATSASVTGLNPTTLYYFRVRATNGANRSADSNLASATTLSSNHAPTDITVSSSSIPENQPSGTAVGALNSTDPDAGNAFTYSLVSGTGSTDNASFTISGSTLQTAAIFDYENENSYSIRVRTTDQGGLWYEKTFTISVINVAEVVPTISGISTDTGSSSSDGITSDPTLLINGTSEPGMTITVYRGGVLAGTTSANGSGNWTFDYTGTSLADGSYNFTATASDTLGHTTEASAPYAATIDTTAPALRTSSINDGAVQRSMVKKLTLTFGEKVVLGTGAVTVTNSDGSGVPNTTLLVTNPSGDQKNYVLSFTGTGVVGGSLADGIYDLSVAAAGVHDLAGNALVGSFSQRFHRLYGDYDGNKTVNNADYFWFKQTFNKSVGATGFLDPFDYDNNGTVNNGDYFQFKQRFGVIYTY